MRPLFILILLITNTFLYAQNRPKYSTNTFVHLTVIPYLEIPKFKHSDHIIHHTAYSLLYSEANKQANWVAYQLTKEHSTKKIAKRTNKFNTDPAVSTGTATNQDYYKSGYDKGHLAPARDMSWSETTMAESFYFSNVSPQVPAFNRGIWKKLEEKVRDWAFEYDSLYIVTGGVLSDELAKIGIEKVSVPKFFVSIR